MIGILGYGLGNVKAFQNIYTSLNVPAEIVSRPEQLAACERFILPGVGSFDYAMRMFRGSGMLEPLSQLVVDQGRPVLGVCVGMQILANSSEEGEEPGLGWIPGKVERLRPRADANSIRLPHMGWNSILDRSGDALLDGLDERLGFYFLHSFRFSCANASNALADADYGGSFTCAVRHERIYGVQFHPEKSHRNGIRLLQNFAQI